MKLKNWFLFILIFFIGFWVWADPQKDIYIQRAAQILEKNGILQPHNEITGAELQPNGTLQIFREYFTLNDGKRIFIKSATEVYSATGAIIQVPAADNARFILPGTLKIIKN